VIGAEDVLVVAPYNNQVALIRGLLPDGARVATVDKFQGQEAPVVLYSMTLTSAEDAPRGVSFLYDLHRLNVAVSRATALEVVVMSEELLDARCARQSSCASSTRCVDLSRWRPSLREFIQRVGRRGRGNGLPVWHPESARCDR
jgi:hypothetical protein